MKTTKILTIMVMVLCLLVCLATVNQAADEHWKREKVYSNSNLQANLMYGGEPADGLYDLQLKLYDDPTDGNQIGDTIAINDVNVTDGYFTVILDGTSWFLSGTPTLSPSLEIGIRPADQNDPNAYTVVEPRQALTAVPFAMNTRGIFVDEDFNVGIGTVNPQARLHVDGAIRSGNSALFDGPHHRITSDQDMAIGFENYSTGFDYLTFNTLKVGIGTVDNAGVPNPTQRLDVNGGVRVRSLPDGGGGSLGDVVVADNSGVLHTRSLTGIGGDNDWYDYASLGINPPTINQEIYRNGPVRIDEDSPYGTHFFDDLLYVNGRIESDGVLSGRVASFYAKSIYDPGITLDTDDTINSDWLIRAGTGSAGSKYTDKLVIQRINLPNSNPPQPTPMLTEQQADWGYGSVIFVGEYIDPNVNRFEPIKVGIGEEDPKVPLHISVVQDAPYPLIYPQLSFSNYKGHFDGSTAASASLGVDYADFQIQSQNGIRFATNESAIKDFPQGNVRMVIATDGNVGIGTGIRVPEARLEIDSDALSYIPGKSGLMFTDLTSNSTAGGSNGKVLTVDNDGDVILVNDATGAGTDNDWTGAGTGSMYTYFLTDNVGIGCTNPSEKLDVNGKAKIRDLIDNSLPDLVVADGTGVLYKRNVSTLGGIGGGGTTNYISKFTASTTIGNSVMYETGGKVGIGTTSPANKLDVEGGAAVGATYSGTSAAPVNGMIIEGNVGIGTTSPGAKLEVGGQVKITGGTPAANKVLTSDAVGLASWNNLSAINGISGSGTTNYIPKFTAATNVGNSVMYETGDNVGIGTTTPGQKLDVKGDIILGGSTGAGGPVGKLWFRNDAGNTEGWIHQEQNGMKFGGTNSYSFLPGSSLQVGTNSTLSVEVNSNRVGIKDVIRLAPRSAFPASASDGDLCVKGDSGSRHIYCYLNGDWRQLD